MARKKPFWDESASASLNARARLPELVRAYFEEGRKLMSPAPSPAAMHRFRLHTKALRYTVELFRPCYGPGLDRRLSGLRKIQDCLGAMNDYATTKNLIASKLPAKDPERLRMSRLLTARAKRKCAEFRRYWQRSFDKQGEERRWMTYLARPRVSRGQ